MHMYNGRQGGGDTCMYVFTLVSGKVAGVQGTVMYLYIDLCYQTTGHGRMRSRVSYVSLTECTCIMEDRVVEIHACMCLL